MIFRVRFRRAGAHVHCSVFVAPAGRTFVLCGTLKLNVAEFAALQQAFQAEFIDVEAP